MPVPTPEARLKPHMHTENLPTPTPEVRSYISWGIASGSAYVTAVVGNERQEKLLDGLKMMGLSPMASMFGWWLVYIPIFTIGSTLMVVIIALVGVFPGESLFPLWMTLELYVVAMIAASFLITSVVKNVKAAGVLAGLAYLSGFVLFGVLALLQRPPVLEHFLCLHCYVAAPLGVYLFFDGLRNNAPLSFERMLEGQTPLLAVWGYLVLDSALYILLSWYCEHVIFGGEEPGFFLRSDFWSPPSRVANMSTPSVRNTYSSHQSEGRPRAHARPHSRPCPRPRPDSSLASIGPRRCGGANVTHAERFVRRRKGRDRVSESVPQIQGGGVEARDRVERLVPRDVR